MNEKQKNDLMFLQNEILRDIKNVEKNLDNKIFKVWQSLEKQKAFFENRLNNLEIIINILKQKTQNIKPGDSNEIDLSKINSLSKKIEDSNSKLDSKITLLRTDLKDMSYKYEKTFMINFTVPGVIGERCPYPNMRDFIENMNKKIAEILRNKDLYNIEFKKQKEKIDSIITQNKNYLPMFETKIIEYIDSQVKDIEAKYKDKADAMNEGIISIKNENDNKFSDFIIQYNDLNEKFTKINEIANNSLVQYNEEFNNFRNSFKDINIKLKNFDEKYNNLSEKLNTINGLNESIKQLKSIYNTIKNDSNNNKNDNHYEENNINYINNNFLDYNMQNEEIDFNSLFNNKQIENKDDNISNKLPQNEKNAKIDSKKRNNKKNYCNLFKYYNKRKDFYDESSEYTKINNIIFDAEFLKRSNYLGNSSINDYYNHNYRIKRNKNLYNKRIKSGKSSHPFPFTTNDNNNDDPQINSHSRNKNNSLSGYLDLYDNNMHKSQKNNKKRIEFDSGNTHLSSNHKYSYLDKKIDILGNVMVDSINKLIYQIKSIKKYNNIQNNLKEKTINNHYSFINKSLKNNISDINIRFHSPLKDDPNFKIINQIKKGKTNQKLRTISQDNDYKKKF